MRPLVRIHGSEQRERGESGMSSQAVPRQILEDIERLEQVPREVCS